jgi:hypothetical protein
VLSYQKTKVEVDGGLNGQNMPFTLGIQTSWQREMMGGYKVEKINNNIYIRNI